MAKYFIEETTLTNIANAIRGKDGTSEPIKAVDMAGKIKNIPNGDTSIEDGLIDGSISGEYENDRIIEVANYGFAYHTNLTSLSLPNCTTPKSYAFAECTELTELKLDNLTEIGVGQTGLCSGCKNLKTFYAPKLTGLGRAAYDQYFTNCPIEEFEFPLLQTWNTACNSATFYPKLKCLRKETLPLLTAMNNYAFQNVTSLTFVDLYITSIGRYVFRNCASLNTIILRKEKSICTLTATEGISGTKIASGKGFIYVPKELLETYKTATNWSAYAEQIVAIEDYELSIARQPNDIEASVGENVSVEVIAMAIDGEYQWQLSKDGGATWTNSTVDGYNTDTINFTVTAAYDGRQYRCVIADEYGNTVTSDASIITILE